MAKRKNNLASSSHHFFMLVVLSVSALGLMLFTYASQQKTQTQSDASAKTESLSQANAEKIVNSTNTLMTAVETAKLSRAISEAEKAQNYANSLRAAVAVGNNSKIISEAKKLSEASENIRSIAATANVNKVVILALANKTAADIIEAAAKKQENPNTGSGSSSNGSDNEVCNNDPEWKFTESPTDGEFWVIYHLKLIDNCPGNENDYKIFISDFPSTPQPNYGYWKWKFANGDWGETITKKDVGKNGAAVNLTISRSPIHLPKKGSHKYFTLKAVNTKNNKSSDTINITYTVEY